MAKQLLKSTYTLLRYAVKTSFHLENDIMLSLTEIVEKKKTYNGGDWHIKGFWLILCIKRNDGRQSCVHICRFVVLLHNRRDEIGFKEAWRLKYNLVEHFQSRITNVQCNEDPHDSLCLPLGSVLPARNTHSSFTSRWFSRFGSQLSTGRLATSRFVSN